MRLERSENLARTESVDPPQLAGGASLGKNPPTIGGGLPDSLLGCGIGVGDGSRLVAGRGYRVKDRWPEGGARTSAVSRIRG